MLLEKFFLIKKKENHRKSANALFEQNTVFLLLYQVVYLITVRLRSLIIFVLFIRLYFYEKGQEFVQPEFYNLFSLNNLFKNDCRRRVMLSDYNIKT